MRLYFCIWRLGLSIKVLDFTFETASFFYFGFRFWLGKYGVEMSLYRPRKGGVRYRIELPLLFVMNDAVEKVVEVEDKETDYGVRCIVAPVVTGKIFGRTLGRR